MHLSLPLAHWTSFMTEAFLDDPLVCEPQREFPLYDINCIDVGLHSSLITSCLLHIDQCISPVRLALAQAQVVKNKLKVLHK